MLSYFKISVYGFFYLFKTTLDLNMIIMKVKEENR